MWNTPYSAPSGSGKNSDQSATSGFPQRSTSREHSPEANGHALDWPHRREFNLRQDVGGTQILLDSGVPLILLLLTTVAEIERHVEPYGNIGRFLAGRYKAYLDDHVGWSKEIWDMAPVAWLLDPSWCESVIMPTPIVTDQVTWSFDRAHHPTRYVHRIYRDQILKDFFSKLQARSA